MGLYLTIWANKMSVNNLFEQFKTLAKKHLGDDAPTNQDNPGDPESLTIPGKDKVKAVVEDFLATTPKIEEAGFKITDLQIELGLIPKLIPHFQKVADVSEAEKERILNSLQDKRLMRLLVAALFKADGFQANLSMKNYQFKGIEVEITALPAVRLNYQHLGQVDEPTQEVIKKP
jgi:hypothetical protein